MQSGYSISDLVQEAKTRWLKPAEVLFILQNYEIHQLTDKPAQKPASGSVFLYNKRVLRFFRKDGHIWRRKKDGKNVSEAHEHLKVGNAEALNCYYARGEQNPYFQRRSYWNLDPAYEHIALVHYRDISEVRPNAVFSSQLSSVVSPTLIFSPSSVEVSSDIVINSGSMNPLDIVERTREDNSSSDSEVSHALRRLEQQLSLNDDSLKEIGASYRECDISNDSDYIVQNGQSCSPSAGMQDDLSNLGQQNNSGDDTNNHHQSSENGNTMGSNESLAWEDVLDYLKRPPYDASQEDHLYTSGGNGILLSPSWREPVEEQNLWPIFDEINAPNSSMLLPQEVEDFRIPAYSPTVNSYDYLATLFDQGHIEMPLQADSSINTQKNKFTIREISPEWGYASEATKVIIIGSFQCDPSDYEWSCMFGDIEVPLQIIQEGVISCHAPPHLPGKVTLCMTRGNREPCSELKDFEYRVKPSSGAHNKSPEELLLLVRFAQMLLFDPSEQSGEITAMGIDRFGKVKANEDLWGQVSEAVLVGTWTPSATSDWLLQELLKDKLLQWLYCWSREGNDQPECSLSKKEQGVIHMVAGLGFDWALNPILNSGVSVDFRDINGWTALHWAARFGREEVVATLIACGASAGALTDPKAQDPTGKTPASIAATCGHQGLAGYLSELALTSHLSSLSLEESELSKTYADLEAEKTVNAISNTSLVTNEDEISLKDTLAAVRNATQAAARIQSAFRAHSFRKRQQREAAARGCGGGLDEYFALSNDAQGLSAASKLAFRKARDYNSAALSIQKNFRGWKGRKDFLAFRQKVVKIQAHVRGHQTRKNYKIICWAVSVLEKVVLRWRRRGVGLRGFCLDSESIDEDEDEDDIVQEFRKQKVDVAIDEAVSRVLSMVQSQAARRQYHRMLERYRKAKAEIEGLKREATSISQGDISNMENDDPLLSLL